MSERSNTATTRPSRPSAKAWDARYLGCQQALFGDAPNEYLRAILTRPAFAAASALMLADGDGRNGTWVAARGIAVTAVDLSVEATRLGVQRDRGHGVTARRIAADLGEWSPPSRERFDLVAVIYLQAGSVVRQRVVELAAAALAPGGWFVLEAFAKPQARDPAIGPAEPDKLYSLQELHAWLPDLELVESLAGRVRLDEGPRHRGVADVVRLCARRPP